MKWKLCFVYPNDCSTDSIFMLGVSIFTAISVNFGDSFEKLIVAFNYNIEIIHCPLIVYTVFA